MLFAHAVRQGRGKAGSEPRAKTNPAATITPRACRLGPRARDRGGFKGIERRGKKPRPLHERSFHALLLQPYSQTGVESHV